ncbi:TetR family transcriptional regulator [Azonexus sp. IMCC34842]|uniref:TetR family transcriptional regulator n=1 Tax=Azonexaceae TaxID=2008795 RepID=UPI001CF9268E|nr:TetR family transcriptional regulator [Dechloromonas denitrificans]UCV04816.1 TetR family transcriptional regulator [Dechloromonas denitrificans]
MARKTKEDAEKTRKDIIDSARAVFHQCGVSRSTLDKIAKEAGVTRGAVYWHFKDKAELFFAMRDDVFGPMVQRTDALMQSEAYDNPLDAIEASLKDFYRMLDDCAALREVFEIMISRCEYVDEFASVQEDVSRPAKEFLEKMERVYRRAAEQGFLREGLEPSAAARDTWAFARGLLYLMLGCQRDSDLDRQIPQMVTAHMALRRRG